ncbi:hypothetical protein ACSS6W_007184 [Trichoderma asperelloides]
MKFLLKSLLTAFVLVVLVSGHVVNDTVAGRVIVEEPAKYLLQLSPNTQQWVTEEEKWEFIRDGKTFMDITDSQNLDSAMVVAQQPFPIRYPEHCVRQEQVQRLVGNLSKIYMRHNLVKLTSFHTRHYDSDHGRQSSRWVLEKLNDMIKEAGANGTVTAEAFVHPWPQSSTIVKIPGLTKNTVIISAHQDSMNKYIDTVSEIAAPGADSGGSGTVTIMEVFRLLLNDKDVVNGLAQNTVEFHWYSAELAGLLGSRAIIRSYAKNGREIKALIHQDKVGSIQGTLDAKKNESIGVITDFTDLGLTNFIKKVIDTYCDIPWVETRCGFACSVHQVAKYWRYPAALVTESAVEYRNIHSGARDTIEHLSFDHMLQHAKMTLGLVYELAYNKFSEAPSEHPPK